MKTFEELGVSEEIRRAIEELGFTQPMPVQEEVIPYLLGNRNDVIALAQTGTGKTAAFGIPVLQHIVSTFPGQTVNLLSTQKKGEEIHATYRGDIRHLTRRYMPPFELGVRS